METVKSPITVLAEVEVKLNAKIEEINKVIKDGGVLSVKSMDELGEIEKEYASQKAKVVYTELMAEEFSKIAAIKKLNYPVMGHQVEAVTDKTAKTTKITGVKLVPRSRQIDLLRFCKFAKLDESWQYNVSALNQSLCLWSASEINYSKSELKELAKSIYLEAEAQKLAKGEKPTSINALCKLLQSAIDAILPPTIEGQSEHKCNNHDVKYLLMCYTRRGKKSLSVKVANDTYLRTLIMDIMHRIIEKKRYDIEYRMVKNTKTDDNKKEESPASGSEQASAAQNDNISAPMPGLDVEHDNELFNTNLPDSLE